LQIGIRGAESWREPPVFEFWMALKKEQFVQALTEPSLEDDERNEIKKLLEQLKDVPSKNEAAERIRALDRKYSFSLWGYLGREYQRPIQAAFEKAAK